MLVHIPLQKLYIIPGTAKIHKYISNKTWDLQVHFRIHHNCNDYYRLIRPWGNNHQYRRAAGHGSAVTRSLTRSLAGYYPGAVWEQQLASTPHKLILNQYPTNFWKMHEKYRDDIDKNTFI